MPVNRRPPSARRFHQLAREIRRGAINDWDLYDLCQTNPYYKTQLLELLNEPAKKAKLEQQQQEEAKRRAYLEHKGLVKRTCLDRRAYLSDRQHQHRNIYPQFLLYQKEQAEQLRQEQVQHALDQKKWMRFVISIYEYRSNQAASWCAHSDLPEVTQLIWNSSPYELVGVWPEGAQCPIDPQPYVPENNAEIYSTEAITRSRDRDLDLYNNRVQKWLLANSKQT